MKLNVWSVLSIMSLYVLSTSALATEPTRGKDKKKSDEPVKTVELFQAIDEGTIEVQFVPKDASQATVIIRNKTDDMLDIQMPKAFGAVHVLGQMGGMMGGMGGGMGGMGGGMGGMGGGMGGMGMGGMGMGGMGMGGMGATRITKDPWEIPIEVYGVVYLFNPVNISRLGLDKVTADTEMEITVEKPTGDDATASPVPASEDMPVGDQPAAGGRVNANGKNDAESGAGTAEQRGAADGDTTQPADNAASGN